MNKYIFDEQRYFSRRLIWVDDVFFPNDDKYNYLSNKEELAFIDKEKINTYVLGECFEQCDSCSELPEIDKLYCLNIRNVHKCCIQYKFTLILTNFDEFKVFVFNDQDYILMDRHNAYEMDETKKESYGIDLLITETASKAINKKKNIRFATRFSDIVTKYKNELETIYGSISSSERQSLCFNPFDQVLFKNHIESWLRPDYSDDPVIADALKLYFKPMKEKKIFWHTAEPEYVHDDENGYFRKLFKEWLKIENDSSLKEVSKDDWLVTSKAMFLWKGKEKHYFGKKYDPSNRKTYEGEEAQNNVRIMKGKILKEIFTTIGINVENAEDEIYYQMPVTPALPFLLALRVFMIAANKNEENNEIGELKLKIYKHEEILPCYHMEITCRDKTLGIRNSFYSDGQEEGGKKSALIDLLKCRLHRDYVRVNDSETEWSKLFTHGTNAHVCGVYFVPGTIHLFWTTKKNVMQELK